MAWTLRIGQCRACPGARCLLRQPVHACPGLHACMVTRNAMLPHVGVAAPIPALRQPQTLLASRHIHQKGVGAWRALQLQAACTAAQSVAPRAVMCQRWAALHRCATLSLCGAQQHARCGAVQCKGSHGRVGKAACTPMQPRHDHRCLQVHAHPGACAASVVTACKAVPCRQCMYHAWLACTHTLCCSVRQAP